MSYPILIHTSDETGAAIWLTAPYFGTGLLCPASIQPPEAMHQVIAPAGLDLDTLKAAIFRVDTETALENLERLGCDLQVSPPAYRRREGDE